MREVRRALLDEGQVREVHAKVRDARRVAAVQCLAKVPEAAVRGHDPVQLVDGLLRLEKSKVFFSWPLIFMNLFANKNDKVVIISQPVCCEKGRQ